MLIGVSLASEILHLKCDFSAFYFLTHSIALLELEGEVLEVLEDF